jgi:hypothetical protein
MVSGQLVSICSQADCSTDCIWFRVGCRVPKHATENGNLQVCWDVLTLCRYTSNSRRFGDSLCFFLDGHAVQLLSCFYAFPSGKYLPTFRKFEGSSSPREWSSCICRSGYYEPSKRRRVTSQKPRKLLPVCESQITLSLTC